MHMDPVSQGDPHVPAHNAERAAINALEEAINNRIPFPGGAATGDLMRWDGTAWVTTDTRFFEGEGNPNGVVAAPIGSRYVDKLATNETVEWTKTSGGDSNEGWTAPAKETKDTGVRNIASLITPIPAGAIVHYARLQRWGNVVSMYLDLTMPTAATPSWAVIPSALPGFSPGFDRYGALQDNRETANTGGTQVSSTGQVFIYNTVSPKKRDRYSGTWLTRDAWPAALPGTAL